ncbi:MurR/RpiR family transcriptional regulator [Fundicoccus sp. Sow4_H7]|uniref:MurR/RpiR family transcriptional regulator n=1 Tax=Fundicoccus sp. Sow4_H7 TaxID=3438784 RepID=UPI003F9299B0
MGLELIVSKYEEFTETEKKIAQHILKNPNLVSVSSAAEFAEEIFVSKTSVINFAKKLNFDGYSELKYFIRSNLSIDTSEAQPMTYDYIFQSLRDEVDKTLQLLDEKLIAEFCSQLLQSKNLYVASRGASKSMGKTFCTNLHMLGISAIFIEDFNLIKVLQNRLTDQDTVLLISLSGKTQILQDFANYALTNNSNLLSITGFNTNPIQRKSKMHLSFYSPITDTKFRDLHSRLGLQLVLQFIIEYLETMR